MRETDDLRAVEETEAGGEQEAHLVCDHPERDDGLVAAAQRVLHLLEQGELQGI